MEFGFPELAAIRLGFGLSPHQKPPADADAVLASVAMSGPGPEAVSLEEAGAAHVKLIELGTARKNGGEAEREANAAYSKELTRLNPWDLQNRIARAVEAPAGFGERLVQFWANHFTVRAAGAAQQKLALAFVDEAIRPNLNATFEEMFIAADTHPMMLFYLNQNESTGPNSRFAANVQKKHNRKLGLNENLAREALELHSIGVGADYSQTDVRQLAALLTGLSYNARNGVQFVPNRAEPGAETVLGKSYGGTGEAQLSDIVDALRDIARNPAVAQFISKKLVVHFFTDTPDQRVIDDIATVWQNTQGNLPDVYRALVSHPALADDFRQKARQPFDYLATALRALGVTGDEVRSWEFPIVNRFLAGAMIRMGQRWTSPIGPNGWPEEAAAWITPQALAARINWALEAPRRLRPDLPDPRGMLATTFGGTQSEALDRAVPKAESAREGVAIILASNDLNRR